MPSLRSTPQTQDAIGGATPSGVVILTIGLSGSSVLAGLLHTAGFWTGPTVRKVDYDTYENVELVQLNRHLMAKAGIGEEYVKEFRAEWPAAMAKLADEAIGSEYVRFVDQCMGHSPWVWKDPRLWVTMPFWKHLLPTDSIKYLLLTREPLQAWVSSTLRRQIQSYSFTVHYSASIERLLREFLDGHGAPHLHVVYEDLLLAPDRELARLSGFLGRPITMEHLSAIYSGSLYRRARGIRDLVTAALIYAKNYRIGLRP